MNFYVYEIGEKYMKKNKKKILLVVGSGGSIEMGFPSVTTLNKKIENTLNNENKKLYLLYIKIKKIINIIPYYTEESFENNKRISKIKRVLRKIINEINDSKIRLKLETFLKELSPMNNVSINKTMENIGKLKNEVEQIENFQEKEKLDNLFEISFTNYEEIAYIILELYALKSKYINYYFRGFVDIKKEFENYAESDFKDLYKKIVEIVRKEITEKSLKYSNEKNTDFEKIKKFYLNLDKEFDVGIVTTNYDTFLFDLFSNKKISNKSEKYFYGFKKNGEFTKKGVLERKRWKFLYHLHGSIYNILTKKKFDTVIEWQKNLEKNEDAETYFSKTLRDGNKLMIPQSLVVGYGKQSQILYDPYKTFFAKLNDLVYQSCGVIFIGYGFNDIHLNAIFENYRGKEGKRVVVIDKLYTKKNDKGEIEIVEEIRNDVNTQKKYNVFGFYCSDKLHEKNIDLERHTRIENSKIKKEDVLIKETIVLKTGLVRATEYFNEIKEFLNKEDMMI